MPRKFNPSQFRSEMQRQISKTKQAINKYNQAVDKYNRDAKHAVDNYNRAVRQHNSKVKQNRSRIELELRRLQSSNITRTVYTYKTSVTSVHTAYQRVASIYDYSEQGSTFQEYVYSKIEQENANNLETANVIIDNSQPSEPEYALQDTVIMDRLSLISKDLDNRWKGALFSLNPTNPDATRHFCTSVREIFTEIFDMKATDNDVFLIFPNCEKTDRGNATRRSKISYFLHRKGLQNNDVEIFVDKDIDNILELFHVLSTGTHGEAGRYTFNQLASIKKRVEDGLIFLCDIAS